MTSVSLDKNKKYKYSPTGDLVESTGELGDNEISISGSKSSLRRAADMERNISILATTMLTTDNGAGIDSPAEVKAAAATDATTKANNAKSQAISAAASDATTKANAALVSAKAYADQAEADAESAASSDATTKANNAKSQAISAAASDATTKANAALASAKSYADQAEADAESAAASDATTKANNAKSQAISAAASDATTKANAAKTAAIAAVTNGAGAAFDTLVEIQNAMATDSELSSAISSVTSSAAATASADATSKANAALAAAKVYADANDANTNTWRGISNSVTSTSTSISASSAAVKAAYDRSWPDTNTTYSVGDGGLTQINFTSADHTKLNGIETGATADQDLSALAPKASPTLTGTVNSPGYFTTSSSAHTFTTPHGNITLGPGNSSWGHIQTDRGLFYMNKSVHINGGVYKYTGGAEYWHPDNDGSGSGLDADLLDGVHGSSYFRSDTGVINLRATSNAGPCLINFSDNIPAEGQNGTIAYVHSDGSSYGSGNAFKVYGTEASMSFHVAGTGLFTGNVTAYYSDERLKDFEGTIPNALDKVKQLNGYYYKGNDVAATFGYDTEERQVGVSAQEVEAVLPEIVVDAAIGEGYKTVQYDKLVPLLIESIKEQQTQIDEQQVQIDELKALVGGA